MDNLLKVKNLPLFAALAGLAGNVLRRLLYIVGTDDKGLLVRSHPLELALWVLTGAVLAVTVWGVWKEKDFGEPFSASKGAAVCQILAGACFGLTAAVQEPMLSSPLGMAWKVLGLLSFPCLLLAGAARSRGKRPFFALYMIPCLFLVFHIINHYQLWSGDPQLQDYVFELFGAMALMLFAYSCAAFSVGAGNCRMYRLAGILAVYLGLVAISRTEQLLLYAGGILWAQSGLGKGQEGASADDQS